MSYENYKNCVEEVKDKNGKVIKYHDVVRTLRGEILLVGFGVNHHHKTKGLNAFNNFIGAHDWLDVYPDGELEILGNVDFLGGAAMNKQEKEDLIQALYDIGGCDAEDEWSRGYDDGVNAAIEVIKELKVQGKVIFSHEEKFVADWLDGLRGQISNVKLNSGAVFMTFIGRQLERYYDEEYSF